MFTKYFIKPIDAYVAMSKSVLEDTKQFNTLKPRVYCPHPLYDIFGEVIEKQKAKAHLGLKESVNYILFFGFIRDYKGLDLLIESFKDPRLQQLNLKLLVAGEFYSNEEAYLSLIKENQLGDYIELHTNFIPDGDVKYYFSAADMIVQPYKTATQSGISQIAYHFNKPMIVTNVGGLPEIVPDGKVGFVVERSPDSIASAVHRFYKEDLEIEFSKNASIEKKKYSWNRMVESITQLIDQN